MSRRAKTPTPPSSLYDDAYYLQNGEFYPENHKANIEKLSRKYSDQPLSEIDTIYRQACCIDSEVQEQVGGCQLSEGAKEELLQWLEKHFHGFTRASFLRAIEQARPR